MKNQYNNIQSLYNELKQAHKLADGSMFHDRYMSECECCHKVFTHNRRNVKYCSDACKVKSSRIRAGRAGSIKEANKRMVETKTQTIVGHVCEVCGRAFSLPLTSGSYVQYCSPACKQKAYRQRKNETVQIVTSKKATNKSV